MPGATRTSTERRREHRRPARYQATLETARGHILEVELADVSTHGCCIRRPGPDDRADWLRPGAFVAIRLGNRARPETAGLQAVVRWVRGDTAGMEFLRPVPAERLDWQDVMDFGLEG